MAYKMKGPSMYKDKLTVNRNGYNGTPEGRAKSSMAQYNKKGAPNYKNPQDYKVFNMGNKPEADEFSGAPMLKGNQHKIDKNKDGKISKADFDMMNKKGAPKYKSDAQRKAVHASKADGGKGAPKRKDEKRWDRYNKRNEKNRAFYEKRKDEFRKDSEGVLRDERGTSVKDRRAEYNAQMRDKAKYETKKPGAHKKVETESEFLARMKKQGMKVKPEVEVKKSQHETERDRLAKKIGQSRSTPQGVKKGMEQSAKSSSYKAADEILAKEGDKKAAKRLKKRAARTKEVKKIYKKTPGMTQAEVDKLMSER